MIIYLSLRLCVKLISHETQKIRKDYICEKHSTTNLFCEMVLVTDSHITQRILKTQNGKSYNLNLLCNFVLLIYSSDETPILVPFCSCTFLSSCNDDNKLEWKPKKGSPKKTKSYLPISNKGWVFSLRQ